MSGFIQATHTHASGEIDHDCSLCVSAHSVVQMAAVVSFAVTSRPVAALSPEPTRKLPPRRLFYKLSCRPPPVVSVHV
jgi:hypothetical protein